MMPGVIERADLNVGYLLTGSASNIALPRLASMLADADRLRLETYLRFEDRISFALGRLLVRKLLSQFAPEPSGGWAMTVTTLGKPVLLRSERTPDLRFNITHCTGLVAAVAAVGRNVGIDAECTSDSIDHLAIARRHLPAVEVDFIESCSGISSREAFLALWTLREAYFKATGEGLAVPSSPVSFGLDPPTVFSDSSHSEKLVQWFLSRHKLTKSHVLAIAAHHRPAERLLYQPQLLEINDLYP